MQGNGVTPAQYQLSHWAVFKSASVPDGGITLILLGGSLFVVESLRRKLSA
jgi:hypothetical protein